MTPTLWLIAAIVVSFCAWTLAVFLLPSDASFDRPEDDTAIDNDDRPN